jgi:hypothetical protein
MAQLSGAQVTQLQTALLDAFDQAELTQMVKVELGEDLESIAGNGPLATIVFALIQWAERHARLGDLVRGAHTQRPRNGALAALAAELPGAGDQPTLPPATGQPASSSDGKVAAAGAHAAIDTGGGTYVGGNVNTGGGDFVAGDKIVHGDSLRGDKITVGAVSGTGVAIGRGARASVQQGVSGDELAKALAPMIDAVQRSATGAAMQAAALHAIEELKQELAKGTRAEDTRVASIVDDLARMVPGAIAAVVSAFATPLVGGLAGPVTQFVLSRLKRGA